MVCMFGGFSSSFPQLCCLQHYLQNSPLVRLLVGGLEADCVLPSTSSGHVHIGQVLSLGCPFSPVGMPKAAPLGLHTSEFLRPPKPGRGKEQGDRQTWIGRLREEGAGPIPGRSLRALSMARRTWGAIGMTVSLPVLSVSAGHRMEPKGPSEKRRSSYRSWQTAETRRPVPSTMSRSSERQLRWLSRFPFQRTSIMTLSLTARMASKRS